MVEQKKRKRHEKIIKLVSSRKIETQGDLSELLKKEGFEVTQATVSRDIRELNLSKVQDGKGHTCYAIQPVRKKDYSRRYEQVMIQGITHLDVAKNILVVKTVSGMAMAVAAALDEQEYPEIVGSIAGDDTIMCAVRTDAQAVEVMERISRILSSSGSISNNPR